MADLQKAQRFSSHSNSTMAATSLEQEKRSHTSKCKYSNRTLMSVIMNHSLAANKQEGSCEDQCI